MGGRYNIVALSRAGAVLGIGASLLASPAPAQVLPGAVLPGRDRQGPTAPPPPDFDFSIVTPHRSAVPRAVDEVHFKLSDIKVVGAIKIAASDFRPYYAALIGKEVTLGDILDVADKIEGAYRAQGYLLVRAYVPPQRVRDGVFTINVVEGYLAAVTVQGGDSDVQSDINGYLKPAMETRPPLLTTLERGLLLTNDIPGVSAAGVLKPSPDKPGASDLVVDIDQTPVTGGLAVDDRGSRFSGLWTVQGDVEFNSIFGADQLAATVTSSPSSLEQIAGTLRYRRAIGDDGLIGTLIGTLTHGEPGSTLAAFNVLTDSWATGARLTYPLIRSRAETLILDGGFTAQDARVDVAGPVSHDRWRVLDLGGSYQRVGLLDGNDVWTSTFDVSQGLPILDASKNGSPMLSRLGGHTDFTKLTGTTRLVVALGDAFSTALNVQGQVAFDRLITGEQIAFGGTQIGRGYDPGAITGDHGLGGSAELRYDIHFADFFVQSLQPYIYTDAAETWYMNHTASLPNQNIISVGGGVRFWLPYNITGALEGARTLHVVAGSDAGKESTKLLLDLAVRF